MNAPVILSLETATMGGSVWLGFGTVELATRIGDPEVSQSATLLSDISNSLDEAGVKLGEVDLFACASGPGSFTGLRIGIATLKALAASLNRPCLGIPTLHAVARAGGPWPTTVALLPAGRGEVFAQMSSVFDDGTVTELDSAAHLSPQRLVERYAGFKNLRWAGSGAHLQRDLLERYAHEQGIYFCEDLIEAKVTERGGGIWQLAAPESNLAKHVAALALQRFQSAAVQSPHSLKAIYVRPSDAELNQCH
ncbi:MAG: tRNA (adenosine(37)-N6)-threonylcarbamoyltransferase complex dimerization subunit type 1 TsaB [Pyrinomonadaceae bacterium]